MTISETIATGTASPDHVLAKEMSEPSVRRRALRASIWVIGAKPIDAVMQLSRSLILTRLLFPEAFGLMAIIGTTMQGLQMCSDVGINLSIIQSRRSHEAVFLQTAWTLQIIRGSALWLCCCLLTWPMAWFYKEPRLLALLPVAGLNVIISSLNSTSWAIRDRNMDRARTTMLVYAVGIIQLVIIVGLAWWLRSVWALVLGQIAGNIFSVLGGHLFLPGVAHRVRFEKAAVDELVKFGKWVFVSTLLTFFAMQIDKLMLGKLIPMGLLGVYAVALVLANQPKDFIQSISSLILLPAMAEKLREDANRMQEKLSFSRGILLQIALLLCFGAAAAAPCFIHYLYDGRYADASWLAQLLSISAWITVLNVTSGYALMAFGDSKTMALGNVANLSVTIIGALCGFWVAGIGGFIIGYAIGTGAGEIVQGVRIRQHGVGILRQDCRYCGLALGLGVVYMLGLQLASMNGLKSPLIQTSVGMGIWTILAGWILPRLRRELLPNFKLPRIHLGNTVRTKGSL